MADPAAVGIVAAGPTAVGIVAVIGAIGVLVTTIFTAWSAFKAKTTSQGLKDVNDVQTKKLDNITVLVDGRYGDVLQQLADMKKIIAGLTDIKSDHAQAATAQRDADAQHARTAAAKEAIAAGDGVRLPDQKP